MNKKLLSLIALACGFASQASAAISTTPVTPGATEGAKKVYSFLYENFGKKTITGIMTANMDGFSNYKDQYDINYLYNVDGGKYPALVGVDFLFATGAHSDEAWFQQYTKTGVMIAKQVYKDGGIPAFNWHWKVGQDSVFYTQRGDTTYGHYTTFDFTQGFKSGTTEWDTSSDVYKTLTSEIDVVSGYFLELQENGVACIWRPLHEAAGAWFWWGAKGAEAYKSLYRLVYDRMVNVNGVKNLIWVWNIERDNDLGYDISAYNAAWYPGDEYVDIIGVDVYNSAKDNSSLINTWNKIKELVGDNHILALTENGPIVSPEQETANGDIWSWQMPWYQDWGGGFIDQTDASLWKTAMASDLFITLDEMPGWGTYVDECSSSQADGIYEVECSNNFSASAAGVNNKSGQGALNLANDSDFIDVAINLEAAGAYKVYVGYNSVYGFKQINCAVNGIGGVANLGEDGVTEKVDEQGEALVATFNFKKGENIVKLTPIWTWAVVDYVRIEKDENAPVYDFTVSDVDGFKVDGAKLLDRCGNEFVMRGVNLAYTWFRGSAYDQLAAINKYGANAVRIVLGNGVKYNNDDAASVKQIVDKCKEYGMVAILEVHDVTGSDDIDELVSAAEYFANMADVLKGTEPYVIINIANEWHNSSAGTNWRDGYIQAIPVIRNAGLRHCIMVDAGGYGQSAATIHTYGKEVLNADVDNNVIFSIHMYGGAGNTNKVIPNIDGVINQDLALCIGEFGWFHSDGDVDEEKILSYCNSKNVSWLAWSWYGNGSPVEYLDVVKDPSSDPVLASYENLTINNWNNTESWTASAEWGKTVTDAWKAEAKPAQLDECTGSYVEVNTAAQESLVFIDADNILNIVLLNNAQVVVSDAYGRVLFNGEMQKGANTLNFENRSTGVYFASVDGKNFKFIKK